RARAQICARRHRGADDVFHPPARSDCRRRRGGRSIIVPAMSDRAPMPPAGFHLFHYATIGSTNDEAKALARAGAADGTLVWADQQTAGRGRRGRIWLSPPGNLYLSLVLRPECVAARAAQLGFVAALGPGDAPAPPIGPVL